MVIHLENANAASPTVVAPVWLVLAAPFAMPAVTTLFLLLYYALVGVWNCGVLPLWVIKRNLAWMCQDGHYVAGQEQDRDIVERNALNVGVISYNQINRWLWNANLNPR
jgi:hypothetical protein